MIIADVHGEALADPLDFESVTSTYEVLQAFQAGKAVPKPAVPEAVPEDLEPEISVETPSEAEQASRRQSWIDILRSKLSRKG